VEVLEKVVVILVDPVVVLSLLNKIRFYNWLLRRE